MAGQKVIEKQSPSLAGRFRGYLPVIVDVETAGFNAATDALLEVAMVFIIMDENGMLHRGKTIGEHIKPFPGANLEDRCLEFTGIDPYHPFRLAIDERKALDIFFKEINIHLKEQACQRAILVGHNAHFDLGFLLAAVNRCKIKRNPFHAFSCLDTASLSALTLGHTVLARALGLAGIEFDQAQAHSAIYDAEKTADLFCYIVNRWQNLGGWDMEKNNPTAG